MKKSNKQKQVKSYLIEEFGPNKGNEIFDKQEKNFIKLLKNKDKTENQMKTLIQNNSTTNCFYIKSY